MVEYQIKKRGINDPKVLDAFLQVPRHKFVPTRYQARAYQDYPLGIGQNQTISQPYIVAYMVDKLNIKPKDKVLEIGTGSGYETAILAEMADQVYSVEFLKELQDKAKNILNELDYNNIHYLVGDGHKGWEEHAPYDKIIVSAAPEDIPEELVNQLKDDGLMVLPIGHHMSQVLYLIKKKGKDYQKIKLDYVRFVPMVKK